MSDVATDDAMIGDDVIVPHYATFTRRVRAVVVDSAVVLGCLVLVLIAGDAAASVPGSGRVVLALMLGLLLLYEPLLIWRRGATIGHSRNQLRVVSNRTGRPPGLVRSFARFIVKLTLGLPSFVTMQTTRRHQAVHDLLTNTSVRVPSAADVNDWEYHLERVETPGVIMPSPARRLVVIIAYLIAFFIANGVAIALLDPGRCALHGTCTNGQRFLLDGLAVVWLGASIAVTVAAWKGLVIGARARKASVEAAE